MLIDLSPFKRYPDFRRLYLGQFIAFFSFMLLYVALPFQMFILTHSAWHVGTIGLVELIPLLSTSLFSGALADRLDRRKTLLFTQSAMTLMSMLLTWNAYLTHPMVWLIYLIAAINSAISGLYRPVLEAIMQRMIKPEDMASTAAARSFTSAICMVCAPGLAGFLLGKFGPAVVYAINVCGCLLALFSVQFIKVIPPTEPTSEKIIASIKIGLRYAASRQELMGTYLIDFVAMIFGMPMALFPILALEIYHNPTSVGWFYAAPAVGGLLISAFSGWANRIKRHGAAIVYSASVWGVAIVFFGCVKNIYSALLFLIIAGAADAVSGMFRSTLWNQTIPHHLRGRLASIEMISYMSGPLLGNAEAGYIAHWFGVSFSIISGGVLCIIGVCVLTLFLPNFWRYRSTI